MKKITYSLIILIILIWAFLNIERLDVGGQQDVINIQTSVYGLTLFAVLSLFSFYPRWKIPSTVFLGSWLLIYDSSEKTLGLNTRKSKSIPKVNF